MHKDKGKHYTSTTNFESDGQDLKAIAKGFMKYPVKNSDSTISIDKSSCP